MASEGAGKDNTRGKEGIDMGKRYYTPREALSKLGINLDELINLVREKRLRLRRDGDKKVFRADEVDALVAETGVGDAVDLSEADHSVLEGYGGGSGLLELTREKYETSLENVHHRIETEEPLAANLPAEAGGNSESWMTIQKAAAHLGLNTRSIEGLVKAGELESRVGSNHQQEVLVGAGPKGGGASGVISSSKEAPEVEIGRTALTVAKKLAETHEAELRRTRRAARLAWLAVAVLAAAGAGALAWVVKQAGRLDLEQAMASNLASQLTDANDRLREEKARVARLAAELATARSDRRNLQAGKDKLQEELTTAREALVKSEAGAQVVAADLKVVKAEAAALGAELERVKRAAKAATKPAAGRAGT